MSRNKQVDKLRAGLFDLAIKTGGIVPDDPVACALYMLKRDAKLIERLQLERNAAVARHTAIAVMWREVRARFRVSQMELGYMRRLLVDTEIAAQPERS